MTDDNSQHDAELLQMRGISKSFSSVQVLNNVSLSLKRGEVLALLGENGAGKSTLMKILCGIHSASDGVVLVDGHPLPPGNPLAAQRAGVSVIHQEFNLIPALSVRENLFLGQEASIWKRLPVQLEKDRAAKIFKKLKVDIDAEERCGNLTVAEQQLVEIAKALLLDSKLIVMDEPTAALSPQEVDGLFEVIRELKSQGISIIYISHRLSEIFAVCDRVTVLRDGSHVGTQKTPELTRDRLIEMMVGRTLEQEFPMREAEIGEERLQAHGLARGSKVKNVSLSVKRGEIVALTGLIGAGRTEVARLLFGADKKESGTITLDGQPVRINNPRQAIAAGVCLLTEDRKAQGLIVNQSVLHNFGLPNLRKFSGFTGIDQKAEQNAFESYQSLLQIKLSNINQPARTLSGGNQQKVVLAKWLERNADIIIFDEPTRGIDVGAKFEIYQLMNQLAVVGKAILMITSELPEALGMADRVLVMHEGKLTGEINDVGAATQEQIMDLAVQ
ncbi:sugar ABC transporter ATP-binding protein [Thalassoglobus sp.]|uniref:sugar ABC transporter ATP-binding protein n=1 Tax=Thalassoglobus sp. TaxID=2795869 RepID=UPI003AA7B977